MLPRLRHRPEMTRKLAILPNDFSRLVGQNVHLTAGPKELRVP